MTKTGMEILDGKETNGFDEYLGVTVHKTDGGYILHQQEILEKLEKDFGDSINEVKSSDSPMKPGYTVQRPQKGDEGMLQPLDQKKYRSGVGILNYLVKHTRPDLCNAIRELSKVMDGATENHLKDLYRVIKYTLQTRKLGYPVIPTHYPEDPSKEWIIEVWVDSDWAGDKDTRRSVTGYEIYVNGVLVQKKSRLQKTVALSSCEAEYIACANVASEVLCIKQVIESMNVTIQYPIIVNMDNEGAIFLSNNESTTRTKHIDVKHHFVRELTEGPNPILKTKYVESSKNKADMCTKNLPVHVFKKEVDKRLVELS